MKRGKKDKSTLLSVNDILDALFEHDTSNEFCKEIRHLNINKPRLELLIPMEYFDSIPSGKHYLEKITTNTNLCCILTAKHSHSGVKTDLREIAKDILTPEKYSKYLQSAHDHFVSEYKKSEQLCASIPNAIRQTRLPNYSPGTPEDYIVRELQYLYSKREYAEFFWWLLMKAIFCLTPELLQNVLPNNIQYPEIVKKGDCTTEIFARSQLTEIDEQDFWPLRKKLISSARGHLIIAGPSLMDAFNKSEQAKCIIDAIKETVNKGWLKQLSIILTDPILFDNCENCGAPIRDTSWAVSEMQEWLYAFFEDKKVELHIYFLPLLQIDHAIVTEEFIAIRSTKLWTREREYKGAFILFLGDCYVQTSSEYSAHKKYLQAIMENSTKIYPSVDINENILGSGSAASQHMEWRRHLRDKKYHYIFMHKLYEKQLFSFVRNSWSSENQFPSHFIPNSKIDDSDQLFNWQNLLGDDTQRVLLDYLKQTETLFTDAIQKHDSTKNSKCEIFPSLDLGIPNNVQRLAGGFATGMLVTWNCGIDIVPIDATVNVCTSSVFRLNHFNPSILNNKEELCKWLKQLFHAASEEKGYSFSFTSGNHFLIIGTSPSKQGDNDYYLVLHSSANELKNSYMGLYPVEGNWYSNDIKYIKGQDGRYFRYLKDDTARHFITMAHHFEQYNEQIHQWLATMINNVTPCSEQWSKHHYYMPTDSSIAIGTFAEPEGIEVPIFSAPRKPVYIFKIGSDNWKVDLGGKRGRVCLIPHGWGQKVDCLQGIEVKKDTLILNINGQLIPFAVNSRSRIDCKEKSLRIFENGEKFLSIGSKFVHGSIKRIITPCFEYSSAKTESTLS